VVVEEYGEKEMRRWKGICLCGRGKKMRIRRRQQQQLQ